MSRDNLKLETILASLAVFLCFGNFYNPWWAGLFILYACLYGVGILQVIHSIYIGIFYWKQTAIKTWLIVYWSLVVLDCTLLGFFRVDQLKGWRELLIGPFYCLLLALLMWFITFRFRRRSWIDARKLVIK